jgi:hypothetical protein
MPEDMAERGDKTFHYADSPFNHTKVKAEGYFAAHRGRHWQIRAIILAGKREEE